jgi:hypothetical protein
MTHAPEYIATMRQLAGRIRDVPKFSVWQFDMLCDWFSFFWNRGTISFVIAPDGTAQGVTVIKLFSRLEQFLEPFVHVPDGQFLMIEVLSCDGVQTRAKMFEELFERWGKRSVVLWDRPFRTEAGAPRMWRWDQFHKLARRFTNYG